MATTLKLRRGTTTQHATFTGALGEVTVDTDKDVVVVHDGSTAGGFPALRAGAGASVSSLTNSGNITFTGTGNRITGDFSNATLANRVMFQSGTTNSFTVLSALPNGTATTSGIRAYNNSDLANNSNIIMSIDGTLAAIQSQIVGTGTYLPMTFFTGGSERMRVDTSGNVGIGTTAALSAQANRTYLSLKGTGTTAGDGNAVLQFQTNAAGSTGPNIGNIEWDLPDNTSSSSFRTAFISVSAVGVSANNRGADMFFATKADGVSGSGTERMRIDASGNVGIGTSSPGAKLDISNVSRYRFDVANAYTLRTSLNAAASAFADDYKNAAQHIWQTSGTERARIDSSGRWLVGTTSVNNGSLSNFKFDNFANGVETTWVGTTSIYHVLVRNGNGFLGGINTNGSTTTYTNLSDYRVKENVQPMQNALSKVSLLKPCTFTYKVDGKYGQGFIAHELQEVFADAVVGEKDAVDAEGNPIYQGIDTSFLVATLTAGLQEAVAMIEELKAKVAALEEK
jgi:hypothetical protein